MRFEEFYANTIISYRQLEFANWLKLTDINSEGIRYIYSYVIERDMNSKVEKIICLNSHAMKI